MSNDSKIPRIARNIVFFGETGAGKSSIINLLLDSGVVAPISNDSQACTRRSARYETRLGGTPFILWDTRGLGEGSSFLWNLFRSPRSETELKKLLEERHRNNELDLLVYCVRGSRATKASLKYYNTFCAVTRRLAAPVLVVVTHLEREKGTMEDWWKRNSSGFEGLRMEFDGHACITSLSDHRRADAPREELVKLLSKKYQWEAKAVGSYFGSPVPRPAASTSSPSKSSSLFKSLMKSRRPTNSSEALRPDRNVVGGSGPSTPTSSTRYSGFYTPAESPQKSRPPTPTVQPPTPTTEAQPARDQSLAGRPRVSDPKTSIAAVPPICRDLLTVRGPSPPCNDDTDSMASSNSMFYQSSRSSHTSQSEVHLQCNEDNEVHVPDDGPQPAVLECLSDQPYKHLRATVKRKKAYPTRSGSFGDIWECELIEEGHSRLVAVKAIKVLQSTSYGFDELNTHSKHEKKFRRELKVWERLQHKNVVPLIGLVAGFGDLPSMVSPWYMNGCLTRYLSHHEELKLSERHRLLRDIAAGLCYLHSEDVVHGDLHSENILIDESGAACLTDFGLSLISDFVGTSYLKSNVCGAIQFADPDLVRRAASEVPDKVVHPTKPCDIYSFGGLILHILSGRKPYDDLKLKQPAVFSLVLKGERPHIPNDNEPWHESVPLIRICWDPEERKRPSAKELTRWFRNHEMLIPIPTSSRSISQH